MIHRFPAGISFGHFESFTDPFRYSPHPSVQTAAGILMKEISENEELKHIFSEGKMLGVLVVRIPDSEEIGFIAAFSGNAGGKSTICRFVPPIFDLLDPDGHFKINEAEISLLNKKIDSLEKSESLTSLKEALASAETERDQEICRLKSSMAINKKERDEIRMELSDPSRLEVLIRESQFEKSELRRLKIRWNTRIQEIRNGIDEISSEISRLKADRARMSDTLQEWIFRQYIVHNAQGIQKSILDIFAEEGMVPPGGTGDCAAPKLLEYAYRNNLHPLAMGEFWYGKSPETAVRTQGHFYPSCTSKCGPLLKFMMRGLEVKNCPSSHEGLKLVYEDESIIVIDKPSGMPSVPGLDGKVSALELLAETYGEIHTVHRLDMDTSGILLFARNRKAATILQQQFEAQRVDKTYHARITVTEEGMKIKTGDKGTISLPLSPDYDERPRQKVDMTQGKASLTDYQVLSMADGSTAEIIFHPRTGRTHQLRVHSAHLSGLGHPILGDMLYGGAPAGRLHLHAYSITFLHPLSGLQKSLSSDLCKYI